jgi:hypothetical protein
MTHLLLLSLQGYTQKYTPEICRNPEIMDFKPGIDYALVINQRIYHPRYIYTLEQKFGQLTMFSQLSDYFPVYISEK